MSEVLAHRSRALTPDETEELLRDRLGDGVQRALVAAGVFTLWIEPSAWVEAATRCRDERLLAYDLFDSLFGVDAREGGFDVVAVLYSTSTGNRIALRARCEGRRESPSLPSLTDVYRGADWMERETYDMFGIDFPGHPGLEPRILTVENFEGWPLRKDFHLAARVAKPWPGVAEPVELDDEGNVIERVTGLGDAPGPYELDKAMAAQAKQVNAPPIPAEDVGDAAEDAAGVAPGDDDASAEVAASATASGPSVATDAPVDEDRASRAKAKAEERRRMQAEARAAKAQARAARAAGDDAPADDATDTSAPTGSPGAADAGTVTDAAAPPDTGEGSTPAPADPKAKAEERRRKQAEAREARAAARAAEVGGAAAEADGSDTTADGAATSASADEAPEGTGDQAPEGTANEAPDAAPATDAAEDASASDGPEPATSAPDDDDRAARARAKAEERRRMQAELRAARAKARAERAEASDDGGDDA